MRQFHQSVPFSPLFLLIKTAILVNVKVCLDDITGQNSFIVEYDILPRYFGILDST